MLKASLPVSSQHPAQLLALTMGDACGIGPEIIAMLYQSVASAPGASGCFVVGDVGVMRRAAKLVGGLLSTVVLDHPHQVYGVPPNCIPVLQPPRLPDGLLQAPTGQVSALAGQGAAVCIDHAIHLALQGEVAGIVTAPIHKEALAAAGLPYPGHTEMLQALAQPGEAPPPVRMMLANSELRTVLVTIHMSLRAAIEAVTFEAVLDTLRIAHRSAVAWGQPQPRIAVAGLNPHAGEGGLFGDEEITRIAPAIQAARSEGIDAQGPFAPDTVFMRARNTPDHPGEFDIVVAMTHDHGLIPIKYLGIDEGVNVTLGLPFVRTSPDHGTAFDIAGKGLADVSSLRQAVAMAWRLMPEAAPAQSTP